MHNTTQQIGWFALVFLLQACNSSDAGKYRNLSIPSCGVKEITEFNATCMTDSLWTGSVALVGTADKTVFRQAWGYTSSEKTFELSEDAIFDMASVTKAVATTSALAICMDRGLVDFSAPFTNYLPEYKGKLIEQVTIRDLARHLSGFNNSKSYMRGGHFWEDFWKFPQSWTPGKKFEYSCYNFIILGSVVEKVTGMKLSDFCQENIFDPLEMKDTHWTPLFNPDIKRVVIPELTKVPGVVNDKQAEMAGRPVGNAGLFSTADDLARFCRMILSDGMYGNKHILSEKAISMLNMKPDTCSTHAFGWRVGKNNNPPSLSESTLSHTGWTGNSVWIDPVQKCFVIVLTNRTGNYDKAVKARTGLAERILVKMHKEMGLATIKIINEKDN